MHLLLLLLIFIAFSLFPLHVNAKKDSKIDTLCNTIKNQKYPLKSADYVAGIDVHGKSVVPADINGSKPTAIYDPITIPIEVDLAQRYGLNLPLGIELKPTIADIKIFKDGRVQYNDVDISQNIQTVCKSHDEHHKKIQSDQAEQHGHESSDPVLSSDKIEGQYPEDNKKRPHYND